MRVNVNGTLRLKGKGMLTKLTKLSVYSNRSFSGLTVGTEVRYVSKISSPRWGSFLISPASDAEVNKCFVNKGGVSVVADG